MLTGKHFVSHPLWLGLMTIVPIFWENIFIDPKMPVLCPSHLFFVFIKTKTLKGWLARATFFARTSTSSSWHQYYFASFFIFHFSLQSRSNTIEPWICFGFTLVPWREENVETNFFHPPIVWVFFFYYICRCWPHHIFESKSIE